MALLELENVCYEYPLKGEVFRALNGIHLKIEPGEFVAIVGSSGCGKTTLMNILGLMSPPSSGTVRVFGEDVTHCDETEKAKLRNTYVGFVFQQFHLLPRLSAFENAALPLLYKSTSHAFYEKVTATLESLGLGAQANKWPSGLSGGQKQRVAIARALASAPQLILADEPTGALDSQNSANVLNIFERLNAAGHTVVIITHDKEVAQRCRRQVFMQDGQIIRDTAQDKKDENCPAHAPLGFGVSFATPARKGWGDGAKSALAHVFGSFGMAWGNLKSNKLRGMLTLLGLTIGVMSIVLMLTLTREVRSVFLNFFEKEGANNAWVSMDFREAKRRGIPMWRGLHAVHGMEVLQQTFGDQARVSPLTNVDACQVRSSFAKLDMSVTTFSDVKDASRQSLELEVGRLFTPSELYTEAGLHTVILGSEAAQKLFPEKALAQNKMANPIGQSIVTEKCGIKTNFQVIGVFKESDSVFDDNKNKRMYLSAGAVMGRAASPWVREFQISPLAGQSTTELGNALKKRLEVLTQNKFPFRMDTPEAEIENINQMLVIFTFLSVAIGILCVSVGGIGVMNIMLVNISERIREIGIRKAVGASPKDIRNQFLFESMFLCLVSGFSGLLMGTLVSNLALAVAHSFLGDKVPWHFLLDPLAVFTAIGTSLLCGMTFGMLPAVKASKSDVVQALRQE